MARLALVTAALFLILSAVSAQDALREVISALSKAQTSSGGFSSGQQAPSLETTANALFLSHLFNLYADSASNINTVSARAFLHSVENLDSGFGNRPGLASDIESTRLALLAYESLGNGTRPSSVGIGAFLRALRDPETGLFANRQGEKPSLKASALALQCYQLTEELTRSHVKEYTEKIKSHIKGQVAGDKALSFSFKNEPATTSSAYYGVVLAVLSGYDFGKDAGKFAQYFLDLQAPSGGFYSNGQKGEPTVQSTLHAVEALFLLDHASGGNYLDKIDQNRLKEYLLAKSKGDLNALAAANLALVLSSHVSDYFNVKVDYEVGDASRIGSRIIQGTQVRPFAVVRTAHYSANHPGFHVDLTVTHDGRTILPKEKLTSEGGRYISSQWVDTSKLLGPLTFDYVARIKIPALGERRIAVRDTKSVGYGIGIESEAALEGTGRQIPEGSPVSPGTEFKFTVTLSNTTSPTITAGNFAIVFSVLDSSDVVVYTKKEDRRTATTDATFAWTLKEANLPAGPVVFRFDVEGDKGVHTSDSVKYLFNVPLVAADIAFKGFGAKDKAVYKLGDTVSVTVTPAAYPDVRGHRPFESKDANGKAVGDSRAFWMDVRSPAGQLVRSVRGTSSGGAQYTFALPLEPKFDLLGSLHVQFRYQTAHGQHFGVSNYDVAANELYDETVSLNFTVRHDLQMADVESLPKSASLYYGNEVAFRFKVKDAVSGKYLHAGDVEGATVYLSLRQEGERAVTSVHEQARQDGDFFVLSWLISANAVGGKGQLLLVAQDADGNRLPISRDGKPWTLAVTIGGSFDVRHNAFSTSFVTGDSVFVVAFSLACQGAPLRDAQLRASLELVQPDNTSTPVATSAVSSAHDGSYSVSWTLRNAEEGRYRVRLYREADRLRQLSGKERRSESQAEAISALPSLFDLDIDHKTTPLRKLPLQTYTLATLVLGAVYAYLAYRKQNYK